MEDKKNEQNDDIDNRRNLDNIPIASREQTEYIENTLVKLCNIYYDQVETLSEKRFGACIQRAMQFDVERGLCLGQIPHRRYIHSDWFIQWEKILWDKINARIDFVSNDFFKII